MKVILFRVMGVPRSKCFGFFILVFCFQILANAQNLDQPISISSSNWSFKGILQYLTVNYNLSFSYSSESVNDSQSISLAQKSASLTELLTEIAKQSQLEYRFIGGQIVFRKSVRFNLSTTGGILGTVVDSVTNEPLPYASVYLSKSTLGTATDLNGEFTLSGIPIGNCEVIFSYVGFKPLTARFDVQSGRFIKLKVKLSQTVKSLQSITVRAVGDKVWRKNYETFLETLFGNSYNKNLCTIKNPEILEFQPTTNALRVSASDLLIIENRALGYIIRLMIKDFVIRKNSYSLTYHSHFDSLKTSSEKEFLRWQVNRLNAFKGSEMHLLRAMYDKRSWEEGFVIYEQKNQNSKDRNEDKIFIAYTTENEPDSSESQKERVIFSKGRYLITYELRMTPQVDNLIYGMAHPTSILEINSDQLMANTSGTVTVPTNYYRLGYMENQRFADKLPTNYNPAYSELVIEKYQKKNMGFFTGIILDSASKKPIENADVFINYSSLKSNSTTDGSFGFELPSGTFEIVVAKRDYVTRHFPMKLLPEEEKVDTLLIRKRQFIGIQKISAQNREKILSEFKKGLTPSQKITNENLINVEVSQSSRTSLFSLSPIEVVDKELGYRIWLYLERSEVPETSGKFYSATAAYFEDLDTLFENKLTERKRIERYVGSPLNFSRLLFCNRLAEEGFMVTRTDNENYNTTQEWSVNKLAQNSKLRIEFKWPYSTYSGVSFISLPPDSADLPSYGMVSPKFYKFSIEGKMSVQLLIPELPMNYKSPKEYPLNRF